MLTLWCCGWRVSRSKCQQVSILACHYILCIIRASLVKTVTNEMAIFLNDDVKTWT